MLSAEERNQGSFIKGKHHATPFSTDFKHLMESFDVHLESDHILLSSRPNIIKDRIQAAICDRSRVTLSENIKAFIQTITNYLESVDHMELCLAPYEVDTTTMSNLDVQSNSSLLALLLRIDCIQEPIANFLLEKLVDFQDEELQNSDSIPRQIIRHIQWLESVASPSDLTTKVLETLHIVHPQVQKELILALPEMIESSYHKDLFAGLLTLLNENENLTLDILDTLSCLSLTETDLGELRDSFIDKLDSARLEDLPVIIKFIFQYIPEERPTSVIEAIARSLDMSSVAMEFERQRKDSSRKGKKVISQDEAIILGAFKSSFQIRPFLQDAWLKYLSNLSSRNSYKDLEVLIMIMIYALNPVGLRKSTSIMKKALHTGAMASSLPGDVIHRHFEGLVSYNVQIISIAEYLIKNVDYPKCQKAAGPIYLSLFAKGDVFTKQDVIASLVSQAGAENESLSESALNILMDLSAKHPRELSQYAVFLKSVYDFIHKLPLRHVHLFYQTLSKIAVESSDLANGSESLNLTELIMMIRKQTGNLSDVYKNIGSIGAACLVLQLCLEGSHQEYLDKAKQVFGIAWKALKNEPGSLSILLDLIANAVKQKTVDTQFVSYFHEQIEEPFLESFFVEKQPDDSIVDSAPSVIAAPALWLAIDTAKVVGDDENDNGTNHEEESSKTMIQIYPCVVQFLDPDMKTFPSNSKLLDVRAICSYFHLLRNCHGHIHGNIEDLDVVLSTPLILFSDEDIGNLRTSLGTLGQFLIADAMYLAVNWLRELVNGFIEQDEHKAMILHRVKHLFKCQSFLYSWMESLPGWSPFSSSIDLKNESCSEVETIELPSNIFGEDEDEEIDFWEAPAPVKGAKTKSSKSLMTVESLQVFLRDLDIKSFSVLKEIRFKPQGDTDSIQIEFCEAQFLLMELQYQVDSHMKTQARKIQNRHKSNLVLATSFCETKIKDFLNSLVDHVLPALLIFTERLEVEIREAISEEDYVVGVVDKPMHTCLALVFEILVKVFTSIKTTDQFTSSFIKRMLKPFASRMILENENGEISTEEYFKMAVDWVSRFQSCLVFGSTALHLLRLLEAWLSIDPENEKIRSELQTLSKSFITKDWHDRNRLKPETLEHLIRCHIAFSSQSVQQLLEYVTIAFPALAERDEEALESFTLLNNQTFGSFYKVAFAETTRAIGQIGRQESHEALFQAMEETVTCFAASLKLVRQFTNTVILSVALRQGRLFVQSFMKHALPFMTRHFTEHAENVITTLRILQAGTRVLQYMCGELKASKDSSLAANVPPLRKTLEQLLFEVKKLLADNSNLQAFWIGNLKHRSITGEEISSQLAIPMTQKEEPTSSSDDQELKLLEEELFGEMNESSGSGDEQSDGEQNIRAASSSKRILAKEKQKARDPPQKKKRRIQNKKRKTVSDDIDVSQRSSMSPTLSPRSTVSSHSNKVAKDDSEESDLSDQNGNASDSEQDIPAANSSKHPAHGMDRDDVDERNLQIVSASKKKGGYLTQRERVNIPGVGSSLTRGPRPSGLKRPRMSLHQGLLQKSQSLKPLLETRKQGQASHIQHQDIKAMFDECASEDEGKDVDDANDSDGKDSEEGSDNTDLGGWIAFDEE